MGTTLGSLMAELEAREAAAYARAEALRARIAELAEQLTAEEELCSRLGITRQTVLEILGGRDDHGRGALEGADGGPGGVERTAMLRFGPRCASTARSHALGCRRLLRPWLSGRSRCPRRGWGRRCCRWPTVTCWRSWRMPGSRCVPSRSPRRSGWAASPAAWRDCA